MRLVLMPTVTLVSMEQCAKTYEVRCTPTPVRVTQVPPGPAFGALARPRAGAGGTSTGAGRCKFSFSAVQNTKEHAWGYLGANVEAAGGRAGVLLTVL